MRFHVVSRNVLLAFCLAPVTQHAQTQSTAQASAEPEYRDQYVAVQHDRLVPLEREKALTDTQNRRNFVITPSTRIFQSIPQPASPIRVSPSTHFLVRMETGDRDPQTLIHLQPLKSTKKDREITKMTYKESLIPFGGVKHDRAADDSIAVTIQKFGTGSLEIIPRSPLPPGEYAFVNGYEAQCFGVDANSADAADVPTQPAPAHPVAPPPPPKPEAWSVDPVAKISTTGQDVMQKTAGLEGQSTIQGRPSHAYLAMHCDFPATEYPGLLPLEVILGGTDEMFNVPAAPGTWLDISDLAMSQLGSSAAIPANAVAQNRSNGARIRLFYDWRDLQQIVDSPGQRLTLSFGAGQTAASGISADFVMPADRSPLQQMMTSCLERSAAEDAAVQAKTVASCPAPKSGNILDSVALKYVDSGKDVKGDFNEEDFGGTWKLASTSKGHPVRKMRMTCSYREAGTSEGHPVRDNMSVPVPATARSCAFTVKKNTLHNAAFCLSVSSRNAALHDEQQAGVPGPARRGALTSQASTRAHGNGSL